MINGVFAQKLQTLDEVLNELKSLGNLTAQQVDQDWKIQRAVERDLQVLVELVIDICQRLLSVSNQSPAATSLDAITRCISLGILSDDEAYQQMVRFRNFIVHRYDRIETAVLVDVVNNRLSDFEQFRDEIATYVKNN